MTPKEFKLWLDGFLEGKGVLTKKEGTRLREVAGEVVAPFELSPTYPTYPVYPTYPATPYTPKPFWYSSGTYTYPTDQTTLTSGY